MAELQSSLQEIEQNYAVTNALEGSSRKASSILQECDGILQQVDVKPKLRVIHHFACSGGTMVSKCIASLPNVYLLSELHPTSKLHMGQGKPKFLPSDVTTQARYAGVPNTDELAWKLFENNIKTVHQHVDGLGGSLVVREHTHSDYCVGNVTAQGSSLIEHLKSHFDILSVVTIRNPIDAYLSLVENEWEHFEPKGFDEYCNRVLAFTSSFGKNRILRYEDIINEPQQLFKKIARKLELPYSDTFLDTFGVFKVTGDSGRSGNTISQRQRREVPAALQLEIKNSKAFKKIAKKFNYK